MVADNAPEYLHTGCDRTRHSNGTAQQCFNPRTHTGCDFRTYAHLVGWLAVSIHAPTRGATFMAHLSKIFTEQFQSTHPHGVRPFGCLTEPWHSEFQSTHPHGVRRLRPSSLAERIWFQSTHPHGVRPWQHNNMVATSMFQSTHPHGVRPLS